MNIVPGQQNGFTLLLLILGLGIFVVLITWQLTRTRSSSEGNPQNLIQTEQKAKEDITGINIQLQHEQHAITPEE